MAWPSFLIKREREREREGVIRDDVSTDRNRSRCVTTEPRVIEPVACFIASMPREEKLVPPAAAAFLYARAVKGRRFVRSFVRAAEQDFLPRILVLPGHR